jgi:hypothetical protein
MTKSATAKKVAENNAKVPDFMATITGNATVKPTTKAKAADASILTNAPKAVKADITKIIKAKKVAKTAKADITAAEKSIIEFGKNHKDKLAFAGNFKKSYKIQGESVDDVVNMVTANKFSFNTDDIADIKEIIGEKADTMLPATYGVSIKSEIFEDTVEGKAKQKELMELLGDRWNDFFSTTVSYTPCEDFDKLIYNELDEAKMKDLAVYMKQSKPSVR